MNTRVKDISDERFGMLTVIHLYDTNNGYARWFCKCSCGVCTIVLGTHLRSGNTQSCGCLQKQSATKLKFKHGMRKTGTYISWQNMIQRCTGRRRSDRYGKGGIRVCKRWRRSFLSFLEDMGERPEGYSIERRNSEEGYSKENCLWIPKKNNTIDSYRGKPAKHRLRERGYKL